MDMVTAGFPAMPQYGPADLAAWRKYQWPGFPVLDVPAGIDRITKVPDRGELVGSKVAAESTFTGVMRPGVYIDAFAELMCFVLGYAGVRDHSIELDTLGSVALHEKATWPNVGNALLVYELEVLSLNVGNPLMRAQGLVRHDRRLIFEVRGMVISGEPKTSR